MMINQRLIRQVAGKSVLINSVRFRNKNPLEKLPRDPQKLTSNQPPLLPTAIYSDEEKLNLWRSLGHFELSPPYSQFDKEEQERLQIGHLKNIELTGVTHPKEKSKEIDPSEAPFNEIYEDGIDENNFTKVRNLTETEPQRWYWVQRLMPKQTLPRSNFEPGKQYPSGYKTPAAGPPDLPYFVMRTRNHLLPVYKLIEKEDERVKTIILRIDGDIWELEQEIRTRLEAKHQKRIITGVNEVRGELKFLGDHVFEVVDYLEELGF